jgi:hypothetical protein
MKFLGVIVFSMSLFSLTAYTVETVTTYCFFVGSDCAQGHAKEVLKAINKRPTEYISFSTTSTRSGMHSLIVYK